MEQLGKSLVNLDLDVEPAGRSGVTQDPKSRLWCVSQEEDIRITGVEGFSEKIHCELRPATTGDVSPVQTPKQTLVGNSLLVSLEDVKTPHFLMIDVLGVPIARSPILVVQTDELRELLKT